jgi:hypothetical protein
MALKLREPPTQTYPNVLLFGAPKTGKTAGACSAPGGVLLLNADLPNAPHYARSRDPDGRIMEVEFEGMSTLADVVIGIEQEANGSARMVDTVVVDPIGELHRRLLEDASKRAIRPTLPMYGDVSVHLERFCRKLCELPVNTVFVCHEFPVKDEASGQFERLPYTGTTNPALGQKLMGMVDIVGYTGVIERDDGTRTYAAQLFTAAGRRGGDRYDVLGDFRALDLAEWFSRINPTPASVEEQAA